MEEFMTVEEAAKYLKRTKSLVCKICRDGGFPDVRRVGQRMWLIPRNSVMNYKPGPQGFAAKKALRDAEKAALLAEINTIIKSAKQNIPAL